MDVSSSAFQLLTERLVVQAHQWMPQICPTFTMRGWGIRDSLISLPLASVSSDKGWQSLSPGTLVLLAGPIGLMATQATELNKNKVWIAGRCQSRLISRPNTYL